MITVVNQISHPMRTFSCQQHLVDLGRVESGVCGAAAQGQQDIRPDLSDQRCARERCSLARSLAEVLHVRIPSERGKLSACLTGELERSHRDLRRMKGEREGGSLP